MLVQRTLDFPWLDTVATDLDLLIEPAQELERPVGAPADAVSRTVEPARPGRKEGNVHELLLRELGTPPILASQSVTADVQLAGHANGNGLACRVEHVHLRIGDRTAERHAVPDLFRVVHRTATREGSVLGGAIAVDDLAAGERGERSPYVPWRQHVASCQQPADSRQVVELILDHLVEQPRRKPQGRHPVFSYPVADVGERRDTLRRDRQDRAIQQWRPDFKRRSIERQRRQLQEDVALVYFQVVGVLHQPHDPAMDDARPLRSAR